MELQGLGSAGRRVPAATRLQNIARRIPSRILLIALVVAGCSPSFSKVDLQISSDGLLLISGHAGLTHQIIRPGESVKVTSVVPASEVEQFLRLNARRVAVQELSQLLSAEVPVGSMPFALVDCGVTDERPCLLLHKAELGGNYYFPMISSAGQQLLSLADLKLAGTNNLKAKWAWVIMGDVRAKVPIADTCITRQPPWRSVFSELPYQTSAPAHFKVTNTSAATVTLEPPSSSCTCAITDAWDSAREVLPGESAAFSVKMMSNGSTADKREILLGILPTPSMSVTHLAVPIYRWEALSMKIMPAVLNLGRIEERTPVSREIRFEEVDTDRFDFISIESSNCPILAKIVKSETIAKLNRFLVTVNFDTKYLSQQIALNPQKTYEV